MSTSAEDCEIITVDVAQEPAARLLGFAPLQLSDDIYNVVNDNLGAMIDSFGQKLLDRHQLKLNPAKVDRLLDHLRFKMQAQQDHLFDEFDKYLIGDLFDVDPNVVLEEDRCQLRYSEKQARVVEERLDTYSKRMLALNACKTLLDNKVHELNAIREQSRQLHENLTDTIRKTFEVDSLDELCVQVRERTHAVAQICSEFHKPSE
ncbi:hypothetical protein PHET_00598 [Paragonimus heterotremus]|uniref:Protein MIS12 homolog n=1 Tax=Paragonimus heterotremus TaxID=100268 RepID=A0A8J4TIV9_9TREM|nr:hypothetical protein PHET_00598 [Paragonimus heterotremus]